MLPQFISLGPFTLNLYTLLIGLAALGPLAWHWFKYREVRIFALALVVAMFALAFGRAGYVALNWDYFREHPAEIASLTGLSEHAAIVGAVIGYWLLVKACQPTTNNQCTLTIAFLMIVLAASLGCISNGCAYGREVFWQSDGEHSLAWLLHADWPDATLVNNPRWPTQALLATWMIVGGAVLLILTRRQGDRATERTPDRLVTMSPLHLHLVILFAAGDFLVQFLRGDAALMPGGLRVYQWFDAALAGLAATLLIARRRAKL
jgi:prolipoprotein diacylglyceryltransferase